MITSSNAKKSFDKNLITIHDKGSQKIYKSVKFLQVYEDDPQKLKASIILNVEGLDTFNINNKARASFLSKYSMSYCKSLLVK